MDVDILACAANRSPAITSPRWRNVVRLVGARAAVVAIIPASLALAGCGGGGGAPASFATQPPATPAPTAVQSTPADAQAGTPAGTPVAGAYAVEAAFPQVNLDRMVGMYWLPGSADQALVLSQEGIIYRAVLADAGQAPTTFLDIRDEIIPNFATEEGLLGLAFAPDYATSGVFYIYYTTGNPRHNRISRFVAKDGVADPASEQVVIELPQKRFSNHNGGQIVFGPDGMLYIGTGDGGGGGDPDGNGQNKNSLLAKILRISVSGGATYRVPADNPFAGGGGAPEVWAYGLRNPWRFSFDPATGGLWAADVGQGNYEEIDLIVKGANYGWNVTEGAHCFKPSSGCDTTGITPPRIEYDHSNGCSVTGGFVYRGSEMPELAGWYVYSDFCSGKVWAVNTADDTPAVLLTESKASVSSFAQAPDGELYLVTFDKGILHLRRNG